MDDPFTRYWMTMLEMYMTPLARATELMASFAPFDSRAWWAEAASYDPYRRWATGQASSGPVEVRVLSFDNVEHARLRLDVDCPAASLSLGPLLLDNGRKVETRWRFVDTDCGLQLLLFIDRGPVGSASACVLSGGTVVGQLELSLHNK